MSKLEEYIQLVCKKLTDLDFDMKRLALDMLNIKIWVDGSNVEITGTIPVEDSEVVTTSSSRLGHHHRNIFPFSIRVISYQESWIESPGEIGEILYAIAGWVAEMESKKRSERTKAGLDWARANGKRFGRPAGRKDKAQRLFMTTFLETQPQRVYSYWGKS